VRQEERWCKESRHDHAPMHACKTVMTAFRAKGNGRDVKKKAKHVFRRVYRKLTMALF
jgi:hypothetical protein